MKKNQPKLFAELQRQAQKTTPISQFSEIDKTRGRVVNRKIMVFKDVGSIDDKWVGVKRLMEVERRGFRQNKPFQETSYYISSKELSAEDFAKGIRGHHLH